MVRAGGELRFLLPSEQERKTGRRMRREDAASLTPRMRTPPFTGRKGNKAGMKGGGFVCGLKVIHSKAALAR